MYYNKKRTKIVALMGVILLFCVCGCNAEAPVQEEQRQENLPGTVTEAVTQEPAEITQSVTEEELKPTEAVEADPTETVYIGVLNPQTGELLQHHCYGNTISDAVMIEKETGLYMLYATECRDFGLHSGYGGVLLAKDGNLTQVWPVTEDGTYDDDYWNQHTARLNGETLERYKVIVTEVSPGDTAISTEVELEQTITLDEILAGAA